MTHDPLACGIYFSSSCDQCKIGWLLDDDLWSEVALDEAHEWYDRMPPGPHKDLLQLRLALLFEREEVEEEDI
jgi:hypothetical protein